MTPIFLKVRTALRIKFLNTFEASVSLWRNLFLRVLRLPLSLQLDNQFSGRPSSFQVSIGLSDLRQRVDVPDSEF
jgi:hypothetical protein